MSSLLSSPVIVCAGPGGVGKTTVSATIALHAARAGRKTLVMTIDPARRLAQALGVDDFGDERHQVSKQMLSEAGVELKGDLYALMPNVQRTFDALLTKLIVDPARRNRLFANTIYQQFSTAIAGTLEYAAVEKLYEMYSTGEYDTIVLDTPPSQNAAAFLSAPGRVVDFLQDDVVQWLMKPQGTGLSWKVFNLSTTLITKTLGKMAGADTLNALIDFVKEFHGLYDGFRERGKAVQELLRSNDCHFVIVSTAKQAPLYQAKIFNEALRAQHMHVGAAVINRVQKPLFGATSAASLQKEVSAALNAPQASAVWSVVQQTQDRADAHASALASFKKALGSTEVFALPELPVDAHSLASLVSLERGL